MNTTGSSSVPAASIAPPFSTASDAPSAKRTSAPGSIVRTVEDPRTFSGARIWYGTPACQVTDALIAPDCPTVPSSINITTPQLSHGYCGASYPDAPSWV